MPAEIIVQSILPMAEFARILTEQAASLPAELAAHASLGGNRLVSLQHAEHVQVL